MGRSENTYRRIPVVPGRVDKVDITELARQLAEMIYALEGRRGPIKSKDQLDVESSDRPTPLKFRAMGNRGAGAISFAGNDNASMYIAKGAHIDDRGNWVADDTTAVIFEMNRDSTTPLMYRNTGLAIGGLFKPTPVGYIATGTSTGAPVIPGTTMEVPDPLTPMKPRPHTHLTTDIPDLPAEQELKPRVPKPHTHLYPDVVGLKEAVGAISSPLQPRPPGPHTHLAEDVVNRARPNDNDWILAGQIFGG